VLSLALAEIWGFIGGGIVTCSLIPQVYRVFRLRSAHEISLLFNILLLVGLIFWIAYGAAFSLMPVILWNAIAVVLVAGLLFAKLKYGR
jgi:MtN3 and saliva related transmembrane protein